MSNKTNNKNKTSLIPVIDRYFLEITESIKELDKKSIQELAFSIIKANSKKKKIFILGNGGSATTASHFACDLQKGTIADFEDISENRLQVISLNDNIAVMTAYANDLSYEHIFVEQIKSLGEKGDLLIVISGSGNSMNVIRSVEYSHKKGMHIVGLLGFKTGGKLSKLVDRAIIVQSTSYGPIEDIHGMLCHITASLVANIKRNKKPAKNKAVPFA